MKPIGTLISLENAMEICCNEIKCIEEIENIRVTDACERVISEEIISDVNIPPFPRASMDGYAVISQNTFNAGQYKPAKLKCLEKVHAGSVPEYSVCDSECSQIATGAMIPDGADAVVMMENSEVSDENILIYKPVYPGENVGRVGEDISSGDVIIKKGEFLTPARIGVLSSLGRVNVNVYRKPFCAIIPTGNEIRSPGNKLSPGQVYDVNSYTLASVLKIHGANYVIHPEIVEDDAEQINMAIKQYSNCDCLIFSGGSSVGEKDVIIDAIKKNGEIFFHGIAIKPGKPTLFGKSGNMFIFGMPGHPASCLSNAYIILVPFIRKLGRLPEEKLRKATLPVAKRIVSTLGRHQFLTVKIIENEAHPVFKTSGAITSISQADGFIEIPAMVDLIERDTNVEVTLF